MLPLKSAVKCQPNKHILLVTYFNSVLVIQAFELLHNSDKFIYYIKEVVLFASVIYSMLFYFEILRRTAGQTAVL